MNSLNDLTSRDIVRDDCRVSITSGKRTFSGIESQIGLSFIFIRAVALKAGVRKDGANVPMKIDLRSLGRHRGSQHR